ncbi:hypothetical protein F2Q68_00038474 [Brassica cretica]|uniref:Uncharacterized protein n=1 Tax=Brassica cretica TaxID=69181 RepID=A0A8S9MPB6_BRACR|nr:hypothetical protein F2Q68_00038474 [Brassica cretica]
MCCDLQVLATGGGSFASNTPPLLSTPRLAVLIFLGSGVNLPQVLREPHRALSSSVH